MLASDTYPPAGERVRRELRHRSPLERMFRNARRAWRRSRLRKAVISLVLTAVAVWAGYKASMYVANQDMPNPAEVGVVGRGQ